MYYRYGWRERRIAIADVTIGINKIDSIVLSNEYIQKCMIGYIEELSDLNLLSMFYLIVYTYSTLARERGASMSEISEALTHTDIKITKTYVNTPNVAKLLLYEKLEGRLNEEKLVIYKKI